MARKPVTNWVPAILVQCLAPAFGTPYAAGDRGSVGVGRRIGHGLIGTEIVPEMSDHFHDHLPGVLVTSGDAPQLPSPLPRYWRERTGTVMRSIPLIVLPLAG
jgi:hypothetical protein